MDEVACLMDWDLQAIVRGCSSEASGTIIGDPHPNFPRFCSHEQDHDFLCTTFPEFSETTKVLDELAELYKPFYPVLHPLSPTSSVSIPEEVKASSKEVQDLQDPAVSKCKRSKKNQNKRVVKQVSADGLCDTWAWRKYGQKPIKGSPYPRSYYRCSSSKGCLARKQVERSHLDPGVFIITYTAEHSHNHPPRTRKTKYSVASETAQAQPSCSPTTPLEDSIEDELVPNGQSEGLKKEEHVVEASDEPVTADTLASYDWFPSIEDLNGLGQEFALDGYFMDFAET